MIYKLDNNSDLFKTVSNIYLNKLHKSFMKLNLFLYLFFLTKIFTHIENFHHEIDTSHRKKIGHVQIEGAYGLPRVTNSEHHIHH